MHVVTSAMITIMVNTFGDRMPKSNPIFSTINSTNPRVFIKAPKATASFRPREKEQMAFDAGFADDPPDPSDPRVARNLERSRVVVMVLREQFILEQLGMRDHRTELVARKPFAIFTDPRLREAHGAPIPGLDEQGDQGQHGGTQHQERDGNRQVEDSLGDQIAAKGNMGGIGGVNKGLPRTKL